ncbi:hypothetical protein Tco_0972983 [Tanacetum coccineum]
MKCGFHHPISGVSPEGLDTNHFLHGFGSLVVWVGVVRVVFGPRSVAGAMITTRSACRPSLALCLSSHGESLPSVPDAYAIAVFGVPRDGSRVHTHDHGGSEAPDGSPNSILSSEPKPLGKHRPPLPPSILSPRESSYPS